MAIRNGLAGPRRTGRPRRMVQIENLSSTRITFRERYGAVQPGDRLALAAALPDGSSRNLDVVVDRIERDAERPWMMLVLCRPAGPGLS
jgi:hypothetical protein